MSEQPTTETMADPTAEAQPDDGQGTEHHGFEQAADDPGGRHPVNVAHLVMGVAFIALVAVWALVASDVVEPPDVRWLLPVPWLAAGVAGLTALVVRRR